MLFLHKIRLFFKKYWKVIVLVLSAIITLIVFRGNISSFADDYKKINEVHEEEVEAINKARLEERETKVENKKKLDKALVVVEKEYEANSEKLDRKKKREVAKLIKDHGNNPNKLAEELSNATGFKVILPEED